MLNDLDIPTLSHNLKRTLNDAHLHAPESYLGFDLETTSLSPDLGHAWQIGLYPVRNGQPVAGDKGENIYLKWPVEELKKANFEIERRRSLAAQIDNSRSFEVRTKDSLYYKCEQEFIDEVYALGVEPKEALIATMDIISAYVKRNEPLICQNGIKFDRPFLQHDCAYMNVPFVFPRENLIDTGMLIKAAKLRKRIAAGETGLDFYLRVGAIRQKGCTYAIEGYCIPKWDLANRFGFSTDQAHNAAFDCWITSLILQELINEVLKEESVQ